jgi:hypothetical protein
MRQMLVRGARGDSGKIEGATAVERVTPSELSRKVFKLPVRTADATTTRAVASFQ